MLEVGSEHITGPGIADNAIGPQWLLFQIAGSFKHQIETRFDTGRELRKAWVGLISKEPVDFGDHKPSY